MTSERIKINELAHICLILKEKLGDDPLLKKT